MVVNSLLEIAQQVKRIAQVTTRSALCRRIFQFSHQLQILSTKKAKSIN